MPKALLLLCTAVCAAAGPITVTGFGSWYWDFIDQGFVTMGATGTDGVTTVAFSVRDMAYGTISPATTFISGSTTPFCQCGNARINSVQSALFSFSLGEGADGYSGTLTLFDNNGTPIDQQSLIGAILVTSYSRFPTTGTLLNTTSGTFSVTDSVPEPSSIALVIAGVLLLGYRKLSPRG